MDKRFPIEDQIEMLGSMIRGRVITPAHPDYDAMREVALAQFDRRPAAIVRVANPSDIATVLNFAQATDLPVAIRAGGHSTGGFSAADNAIVIDVRDLNAIEVDTEARTAWAGAGCTAGEVTRAVEQHDLIVGFGASATVGIGGLTLGGGIGYLVRSTALPSTRCSPSRSSHRPAKFSSPTRRVTPTCSGPCAAAVAISAL